LRSTFGPAVAGLLGGAFLGLAALPTAAPLSNNVAHTYDSFPSLPVPSVASDVQFHPALQAAALILGFGVPILTGAFVVWLARPRDVWEDASAGVTAALAAALSAFASCIGWAFMLAFVIVPSIYDLTLLSESRQQGADLAERYPDLEQIEPEQRGGKVMAKVVSDQVDGGARAARWGVVASLLTMGTLAFSGTLAAGALRRRNEPLRRVALPYLEMVVPATVSLAWGLSLAVSGVRHNLLANPLETGVVQVLGLAGISAVMIAAALRRWPWAPRTCLALTGVVWLIYARQGLLPWLLVLAAAAVTGIVLLRHARTPEVAAQRP
jgi:hypothetical protein